MKKFIGLMAILSIVSFAVFGSLTASAGGRCGDYKGYGSGRCYEKGCKKMCNYGNRGYYNEKCGCKKKYCNKERRCEKKCEKKRCGCKGQGYWGNYGGYEGGYYEKTYGRGYYGYGGGYGDDYYGYGGDDGYDSYGDNRGYDY